MQMNNEFTLGIYNLTILTRFKTSFKNI